MIVKMLVQGAVAAVLVIAAAVAYGQTSGEFPTGGASVAALLRDHDDDHDDHDYGRDDDRGYGISLYGNDAAREAGFVSSAWDDRHDD